MGLFELTARQGMAGIARGDFTIEELVLSHLDRIAEVEGAIGAWEYLDRDAAIAEARRLDAAGASGALHGALVGVKDVICTAQMPTTFGSRAYAGYRPPYDASCVALSRAAGAMMLGKTVSTEFAAQSPGKTRNPFALDRTPGGSSSGSAAAVAAKMVPLALATQTAGSTIRPAAFCGVVGYKPSYGLIDPTGLKTLATCFDTVGIIARDVRDVAFYASVMAARADLAVGDEPATPHFGVYQTESWHLAEPAARDAIDRAACALGRRGDIVEKIPLTSGFDDLLSIFWDMVSWGVTTGLAYERLFLADRISAVSREMLEEQAAKASPEKFAAAEARAVAARAKVPELFGDCDVLLAPPATGEAPLGLEKTGDASFNCTWTMLHLPCITVPAGTGPNGLPVGVQLVGRNGDDARLLSAAAYLEAALAA